MKKFFTLLMAAMSCMAASAKDYTDQLTVNFGGATTSTNTISLDRNEDGTLNLVLHDFSFSGMPIGDVQVDNISESQTASDRSVFYKNGTVTVSLMGQTIELPLEVAGYDLGDRLYAKILIKFGDSTIDCTFGQGFQFQNGGFENYEIGENAEVKYPFHIEPYNWHGFESADGDLAGFVSGTPHTFISEEHAPGSTGQHSVLVTSVDMWLAIANGTLTTGRLHAGAVSADDSKNNAYLDMSKEDVDKYKAPFYQYMDGTPDSLAVWVKFIQGTPQEAHPYATISTAITDGTYYQEPCDKEYTNILGVARNNKIVTNNGEWQRLVIPFDYDSYKQNGVEGKAIFATISTNADPGCGSTDSLYVDDIQLIYNNEVKSISFKGNTQEITDQSNVAVTFAGSNEQVSFKDITITTTPNSFAFPVSESEEDGNVVYTYAVLSNDLSNIIPVRVAISNATGIHGVTSSENKTQTIYNINGQRVQTMQPGQVYIVKDANGTHKVIK